MSNPNRNAAGNGAPHADGSVAATAAADGPTTRESVVKREKEQYGGMKFGSAFFGWLTATGTAVILIALLSSTGTAIGLGNGTSAEDVADATSSNADTIGIVGGIILAVILLIAYFCGGYVAGRMARFDGVKQGIAVWLWALVIAIVLAVVGLIGITVRCPRAAADLPPSSVERRRTGRGKHHHRGRRACREPGRRDPRRARRNAFPPPGRQGRPRPLTLPSAFRRTTERRTTLISRTPVREEKRES